DIGGIVAADLRNSGKFNPLDRSRLPQQPATAQEVQPAAWSALAPDLLPEGTVNVYYEAAAVIVALILLGRFLEARAKGRTSEAI
ncbi:hypothetical protein MJO10_30915, partial [Salmonella enterica subsp. enterica serovar Anatum]|nr:hypothetical protein [Salmonella enterica subsp. enterica serovar Anatum]